MGNGIPRWTNQREPRKEISTRHEGEMGITIPPDNSISLNNQGSPPSPQQVSIEQSSSLT